MNDPSQMMMNRGFGIWPPPAPEDPMGFSNPSRIPPPFATSGGAMPGRIMNWKAKKAADHRNKKAAAAAGGVPLGGGGVAGVYNPPALQELQYENRVKARRFYPKKKFIRSAPFAPRNTTSFLIRAKKSGGIAPLVSPCPVTPAVLPTPKLSPTREDLADMVKEEWGVDGYGSMKGLIRLRSPNSHEIRPGEEEDDNDEETSSESDVEEHLEVERRLDHDVSRFEMVYPGEEHGSASELLESRVNGQDVHISQLEEENMTLKERLFLMERGRRAQEAGAAAGVHPRRQGRRRRRRQEQQPRRQRRRRGGGWRGVLGRQQRRCHGGVSPQLPSRPFSYLFFSFFST